MALQSSGPISLLDIQGEFGGSAPISISEYYSAAAGVPASGAIDFADFYGTSALASNLQATYAGNVVDEYTSAGIYWRMRQKLQGVGTTPTVAGYVILTGTGTFPCIYASNSSVADGWIADFAQRAYVGFDGQYTATHSQMSWTKLQLTADGGRTDYIVYGAGRSAGSYTQVQDYVDGIDGGTLAARIDWYNT